ncbi:FMRFamide receptor [Orchesella cincta]|uniref:FMRFamide receptor n=1 Tax=Orchesella cincta TaxID=48709 RepID=A0A1D2NAC1_ORCCI|nr:FMRFamide receptor [Orchesella cincta]
MKDWGRGPVTLFMYYMPFLLSLLGRSGSSYMTVLITVERFLVIRYPIKSGSWFTPTTTKLMTVGVAIFAVLLNIPRVSSLILSRNDIGRDVPSLHNMEYIIRSTELEEFWYHSLKSVHYLIDMMVPFPLLIIFNILLFIEIKRFTSKRKELSRKQMKDIRAARMFVPVVIVLFLCNIEPMTHYLTLHITGMYYRELVLLLNLSITVNASANLPIYYARGSSFRLEIQSALPAWWFQCRNQKPVDFKTGEISMTGKNTPASSSNNCDPYY